MTRKQIQKILLLLILFMASAVSGFGEDQSQPQQGSSGNSGDGILDRLHSDSMRKRMPSRNFLLLNYENGLLSLQSETTEGVFSLELVNSDTSQTYTISSIAVGDCYAIDLEIGYYEVAATDSYDCAYSGNLTIN